MIGGVNFFIVGASVTVLAIIIVVFVGRSCCRRKSRQFSNGTGVRSETFQSGIARIHHASPQRGVNLNRGRNPNLAAGKYSPFNWFDHPLLITDAFENGWPRFAFSSRVSSPSTRSTLLGLCAAGDDGNGEVEMAWEIFRESSDFMQIIRLNPGLTKINSSSPPMSASCVVRSSLPLPGPPLASFPQEAYFEIEVMSLGEEDTVKRNGEGEKTKLIHANPNKTDGWKVAGNEVKSGETGRETVEFSVGFAGLACHPSKLPGSYRDSIGFNSTGSIFNEGVRLTYESEEQRWQVGAVIGCGFDPSEKRVYFTVDGEMVRLIHCKSAEFESPLFPVLAANADVRVLANFGQIRFKYARGNTDRTPNPCFRNESVRAGLEYEDSRELFSMEGIDPGWRSSEKTNAAGAFDIEQESESDLFEIILESPLPATNRPRGYPI